LRITFTHAEGLQAKGGGELKGFVMAGSDGKYHWASASILGKDVLVTSPKVSQPVFVRYAWANNPDANLTNAVGLPASPFAAKSEPENFRAGSP
jgi:sialate O-acetylesterase